MTTLLIRGGTLITPFEAIDDGALFARDGVIERVGRSAELSDVPADVEIDATGKLVCPGFVDLQVNGGGGALLTDDPTESAIERMTRAHARFGTTSMLPTIVTASEETLVASLRAVRAATGRTFGGARVLGSHMEGPFISMTRKGAHDERYIREPDAEMFERLLEAADGTLRIVTIAPELPHAVDLYRFATAEHVAVSIGHTDATYEEALAGIDAGATFATHVFNAMRPITQRDPGVIGAVLEHPHVTAGLIPDAVHVHPSVLGLVARSKGVERTALVTDAIVTPDNGAADLGGRRVELRDGAPYLADGTLAGSALTMNEAVRRMHERAGLPLIDCVRMATETPARVLGLDHQLGVLRPGAHADIVICDEHVAIDRVIVSGTIVHDAASAPTS
jgi:N-acetylglucosamine-6-phosphate deacetylase